jgi:hypothetical protein
VDAALVPAARCAFDRGERSRRRWLERSGAVALPEPEGWEEVISVDDEAALVLVMQRARG